MFASQSHRDASQQLMLPGFVEIQPVVVRPSMASLPVWYGPIRDRLALSPYEREVLLRELRDLNRCVDGPLRAPVLAGVLGISERTARFYLVRLERAGLVHRPAGPRSGWAVI